MWYHIRPITFILQGTASLENSYFVNPYRPQTPLIGANAPDHRRAVHYPLRINQVSAGKIIGGKKQGAGEEDEKRLLLWLQLVHLAFAMKAEMEPQRWHSLPSIPLFWPTEQSHRCLCGYRKNSVA